MHRDLPSGPQRVLEAETRVLEPPSVDELDGAVRQDDAGPRRNGIDHESHPVLEGLELPEGRAPPGDQAGDDEGGGQEREQGHQVERLEQRARESGSRQEGDEGEERDE
jgi:hypothetical protein